MVDPYAYGVLQREHHDRLVANLENFTSAAGIQPHWIYMPLPDDMTAAERDYLRRFRKIVDDGSAMGLCYHGKVPSLAVEQRMSAVAGCLTRNFIRARMMTLGQVTENAAWEAFLSSGKVERKAGNVCTKKRYAGEEGDSAIPGDGARHWVPRALSSSMNRLF